MRRIYLIRHALPDFLSGERMCLGSTDLPLGAEGLAQAAEMAKKLPPVTAVFSSPLSRAVQTAKAIDPAVTILSGLRENHMGAWDGLTFRQIRETYPALYEARGKDPSLPVPGQEDTGKTPLRFRQALEKALDRSAGDIAVVSHGGAIAAFLKSLDEPGKKPGYGQILLLTYDGDFHLQEEEFHA